MLAEIAYWEILGKPLIMYLGLLTLASFLFTASIAIMNKRGITKIPFKWHPRMAKTSIGLAIIHGLLAMSIYFGI
ncbi:MAG: hypothetical protein HY764_02400 [Candidatus Portnoybacteria bacterium]|nr:hypothetical protein [Candidatus Portnoybacteria bacterium]